MLGVLINHTSLKMPFKWRSVRKIRSGVMIFLFVWHLSLLKKVISKPTALNVEKVETAGITLSPQKSRRQIVRQTTIVRNNKNRVVNGLRQEVASHMEKSHITPRIINGMSAQRGRYPYIVSLTHKGEHRCGGSLIAPDIILSAAHCATEDIQIDGAMIGRYDLEDNTEVYEHFVIESTKNHPKFSSNGHSLNYDFMLVKIYGTSKYSAVKINGNPKYPSLAGESLNVMGWGVSNVETKEAASVLQEVEVKYISNDVCNQIEGYYANFPDKISLDGEISEVMICAKDEGEDACQGDSGGPLIIRGKSQAGGDDLLVGVVSWGIGCAHQNFPGVYARISNQIGWINRWVCEWSESPPFDLGKHCSTGSYPTKMNVPKQSLIVEIHFDRYPQETGWLIRSVTDTINTHIFAPVGTYKGKEFEKKIVQIEVFLDVDREYEFIMLDSFGDGLHFDEAKYYLYRMIDTARNNLVYGYGADFTYSIKHAFDFPFVAMKEPTPAPVILTYPTIPPTSSPTMERATIFIEFKFDKYPEEVGWEVLSAYNGKQIASKQIGSYSGESHQLLTEKVWLLGPEYGSHQFLFTVYDMGNNGLCCDHGPGYYKVYLDEVNDSNLLFGGDLYLNKEQYYFEIHWPDVIPTAQPVEINAPTVKVTDYPTTYSGVMKDKLGIEEILNPFDYTKEAISDIRPNAVNHPTGSSSLIVKENGSNVQDISFSYFFLGLQTVILLLAS